MNKQDREKANLVFEALTKKLPGSYIEDGPAIAKVSTVGAGMAFKVGTAGKYLEHWLTKISILK